jgi:hypothetical protein
MSFRSAYQTALLIMTGLKPEMGPDIHVCVVLV